MMVMMMMEILRKRLHTDLWFPQAHVHPHTYTYKMYTYKNDGDIACIFSRRKASVAVTPLPGS